MKSTMVLFLSQVKKVDIENKENKKIMNNQKMHTFLALPCEIF
jgi:hypothetical protein